MSDGDSPADASLREQLQASLGTSYVVERELGGSGMSRVFVADEPGLARHVVIKVLTPELSEGISAERFAREIRLAASLQQANIVPVLSAGTAAGLPWYTMPFVEGLSLRERLARDGPLSISESLNILRDVARALAYAHARGVVHRDIKPGNVLLSGGTAVVTDFGIAKALGAARDSADATAATALTRTGTAIGTPAYMAPEQATGDPGTDHRADIYAFGCLAYEVLTGRPPFQGATSHEVVAAHFTATPPPVTSVRPEVPAAVAELVARCLEKEPGKRPQHAEEILSALDSATSQPGPAYRPYARRRIGATIGAVTILVLALALVRPWPAHRVAPPQPLVLGALPFLNLAHDTALDYLSDGLSDELLTALGKLPGVRISGRQSAYRYKGQTDIDPEAIERELGVRFLVTGTLREGGDRLTISTQLNDSATHGELWSGTFVRARNDFGSVTDEIARALSDTLRSTFPSRFGAGPRTPSARGTTNAQALDQYLIGQEQLKRRAVEQSAASFERAITFDPRYARAHAALAEALTFYPYFLGTPVSALRDSTMAEASRALAIDPWLADPHVALGVTYENLGQWTKAESEFRDAVRLEPDNFEAHFSWARTLVIECKGSEALQQLDQADAIERVSGLVAAWRGNVFYMDGQVDSALAMFDRGLRLAPTQLAVLDGAAIAYVETGRTADARRLVAQPQPETAMAPWPYVLAKLGDTTAAENRLQHLDALSPRPWFIDVERALVRMAVGDTAAALDALEASARKFGPAWLLPTPVCSPTYDPVRMSPRFADLLRQANLDVEHVTTIRAHR